MAIYRLGALTPTIAPDAFIAPDAQIIGDVTIGAGSSVWFGCVLRGDGNFIKVGDRSNIQDGTIVHITTKLHGTTIGDDVLIGHQAIVHGCTLEDHSFVGMGATVMDGCVIESDAMLAAGALLTPGKRIARGQLWAGAPAKPLRDLTPDEIARNRKGAAGYAELAQAFRRDLVRLD
jgi:carbonic anhydrase/acetyltransferase-like protein (isoleucine patch superfamily)